MKTHSGAPSSNIKVGRGGRPGGVIPRLLLVPVDNFAILSPRRSRRRHHVVLLFALTGGCIAFRPVLEMEILPIPSSYLNLFLLHPRPHLSVHGRKFRRNKYKGWTPRDEVAAWGGAPSRAVRGGTTNIRNNDTFSKLLGFLDAHGDLGGTLPGGGHLQAGVWNFNVGGGRTVTLQDRWRLAVR